MGKVHAKAGADQHQRTEHIGGIANKSYVEIFKLLAGRSMFDHGQHIANHLGGMVVVGQSVDQGNRGISCQTFHGFVFQSTRHDHIHITRDHLGGITQRFAHTEMNFTGFQVEGVTAQLSHTNLKRDARAGGGFFKEHGK